MGESAPNVNGYAGNWANSIQISHGCAMPVSHPASPSTDRSTACSTTSVDEDTHADESDAPASSGTFAATASRDAVAFVEGGVRFVSDADRATTFASLSERGGLTVQVPAPKTRGTLATTIDDAIEGALQTRGAPPSATYPLALFATASEADAALSDQIFRAKKAGFLGLVLSIPSLAHSARPLGVLESTDAAFLRFYAKAAAERPLLVLLAEEDAYLGAYGDPIPLTDAIFGELEDADDEDTEESDDSDNEGAAFAASARADVEDTANHAATDKTPIREVATSDEEATHTLPFPAHAPVTQPYPDVDHRSDHRSDTAHALHVAAVAPSIDASHSDPELEVEMHAEIDLGELPAAIESAAPITEPSPASAPSLSHADLAKHVGALSSARGPQSLAMLEATFVKSYVPVDRELGMGNGDARAKDARDEFRRGFARAYTEAFPTLAVRGRRPRMVLDALGLRAGDGENPRALVTRTCSWSMRCVSMSAR